MKQQKTANIHRMSPLEKKEFYKELYVIAIPVGLQTLLGSLIGATDALMLGRLHQDAISAVSLANQIAFIMFLFLGAVLGGGGSLIAQYWGKGEKRMANNLFCMICKWSLGISVVFFSLAMLIPRTLMRIYTPEPALIEIGAGYLRVVALSYLFKGITQCFFLVMKIGGKAARSVVISVATLIANMVLNLLLVYGLAGFPRLGANGTAYATVIVELIALVWCLLESRREGSIRLDMEGIRWRSAAITKDFIRIATPALSSSLAWGIGITMHSMMMGHFGSDATAAASITSVVQNLVTCVCQGVSAGAGIILGKLLGQNQFDKAKAYGRKFCHMSFWIGGIHMLLFLIVGPIVARFFVLSETAKHYLMYMMLFMSLYVAALSINNIVVCGVFKAGGDTKYDAVSVLFASWCFSLPLALLGTFVLDLPVMAVYILMKADEIVKLPWIYPHYRKYIWVKNLTREEIQGEKAQDIA